MGNENLIKNILVFGVFVVGALSSFVANLFGGYYIVAALVTIMSTLFVCGILDKNIFKENKEILILMLVTTFFEFVFFLVNDIVGYSVSGDNAIGFFKGLVIFSQLYSASMIVYYLIKYFLPFNNKTNVEVIVENNKNIEVEEKNTYDDLKVNNNYVEDIKKIPQLDEINKAPHMEEHK